MNDNLHSQIRASLTRKGTDELVEIWRRHNLDEWTELTFDIIREILQERRVELPPQENLDSSKIGAGIDKSPDIRELEGKIKESEVLLAEANRNRFSGCLPLLISLGVMLTMAVKIPGGDIYVIMTMAGMLYFGFNLWRLLLQRKVANGQVE